MCAHGKFSEENMKNQTCHWEKVLDTKHPTFMFAAAHGLQQAEATEDKHQAASL